MAFLLPIKFEDNDDIVMLLFASGQYTGTPEFRLVFINSIFGYLIKLLYTITTKIEWYSVLFSLIHILSIAVILWKLINANSTILWKFVFVIFVLAIEARLITQFQFTTTAAIASLSGLILLSNNERKNWIYGIILFCIGTLIRFESSILVLILFSPSFIKGYIDSKSIDIIKRIGVLFILVLGIYFINYMSYQMTSEWKLYYEFNKIRGKINDNPNSSKISFNSDVEKINYDLLLYSMPDNKSVDIIYLKEIKKKYPEIHLIEKTSNIFPSIIKYTRIYLVVFIISIILFFSHTKTMRIYLLSIMLLFFSICIAISLNGVLKERVFYSSILPVVFLLSEFELKRFRILSKIFVIILVSYMNFFMIQRVCKISQRNKSYYSNCFIEQKMFLFDFAATHNNYNIVPFASSFNFQSLSPFSISSELQQINILFLGWATKIPYNKNKIISHNDFNKNNVIFITQKKFQLVSELLKKNYWYNYNAKPELTILNQNSKYLIFKFETEE